MSYEDNLVERVVCSPGYDCILKIVATVLAILAMILFVACVEKVVG